MTPLAISPAPSSSAPVGPVAARAVQQAAAQVQPQPNAAAVLAAPALHLDPGLGLVVLEFRDLNGQPRTIPTARELESYRTAALVSARPNAASDQLGAGDMVPATAGPATPAPG